MCRVLSPTDGAGAVRHHHRGQRLAQTRARPCLQDRHLRLEEALPLPVRAAAHRRPGGQPRPHHLDPPGDVVQHGQSPLESPPSRMNHLSMSYCVSGSGGCRRGYWLAVLTPSGGFISGSKISFLSQVQMAAQDLCRNRDSHMKTVLQMDALTAGWLDGSPE